MATETKARRQGEIVTQREFRSLREEVERLRAELEDLRSHLHGGNAATLQAAGLDPRAAGGEAVPPLPPLDQDGNYPAVEAIRVIVARQILRRRQAAGWTQADLAARAGVRQETVSRLESGKHAPNVRTVDRIDRALREVGV
jgi:DNA-binding XRE family transcriptional regulator